MSSTSITRDLLVEIISEVLEMNNLDEQRLLTPTEWKTAKMRLRERTSSTFSSTLELDSSARTVGLFLQIADDFEGLNV